MASHETYVAPSGPGPGVAGRLVPVACLALLMGLPPVLSLPGLLEIEDEALAFSGTRALAAFGLLVGAASAGLTRGRRMARLLGVFCSVAYAALVAAALLGWFVPEAELSLLLGSASNFLVFLGACSCSWMLQDASDRGAGSRQAYGMCPFIGTALLAAGAIVLSIGAEPCWSLSRLGYDPSILSDASTWWIILPYDLAGIMGPGPHTLSMGTAGVAWSQLGVLVAWFLLGLAAIGCERTAALGLPLGVLGARMLAATGADVFTSRGWGLLLASAGVVALVFGAAFSRRSGRLGEADGDDSVTAFAADALEMGLSADDFDALSPREHEATMGRLAGKTSSELAGEMGVKPSTVRNLQARAASKLGVSSLDELANQGEQKAADPNVSVSAQGAAHGILESVTALLVCALSLIALRAGGWSFGLLAGELIVAISLARVALAEDCRLGRTGSLVVAAQIGLLLALLESETWLDQIAPERAMLLLLPLLETSALVWALLRATGRKSILRGLTLSFFLMLPFGLAAAVASLLVFVLLRLTSRSGVASPGVPLAFGCGVVAGLLASWPLETTKGLLVIKDEVSGLVSLSSLSGFVLGILLLAGAVSAFLVARDVMVESHAQRAGGALPDFERRLLALCESRGLNETQSKVVACAILGMTRSEICSELCVSAGTVNRARAEAHQAFDVHTSAALTEKVLALLGCGTE